MEYAFRSMFLKRTANSDHLRVPAALLRWRTDSWSSEGIKFGISVDLSDKTGIMDISMQRAGIGRRL